MAYGYGKTNWKLEAEAQAVRREAQAAQVQKVESGGFKPASGAQFDAKRKEVVYPAQLNVKFNGQFVGRGWRKQTQFGPCLTLQLEQDVPAGGKLLIVPRRQFPDCLG